MDMQFFSIEALTSVVAAMFAVAFIMQIIKLWWDKLIKKPMWECVKATLPFIIAFPVFVAWSAYHNEGLSNVSWHQAPLMIIMWGASSSYVYRWVVQKISVLIPGGEK